MAAVAVWVLLQALTLVVWGSCCRTKQRCSGCRSRVRFQALACHQGALARWRELLLPRAARQPTFLQVVAKHRRCCSKGVAMARVAALPTRQQLCKAVGEPSARSRSRGADHRRHQHRAPH